MSRTSISTQQLVTMLTSTNGVGPAQNRIVKLLEKADRNDGKVKLNNKELDELKRDISISQSLNNTNATNALNQQNSLNNALVGIQNQFPNGQIVGSQNLGNVTRFQILT